VGKTQINSQRGGKEKNNAKEGGASGKVGNWSIKKRGRKEKDQ